MANVYCTSDTSVPAKNTFQPTSTTSRPEKIARWLFETSSNWRNVLGFLLIVALTVISIRFNYELGELMAVDETSKELLPNGYALLDLCCLFISGGIGIKSRSRIRRFIAWIWFVYLLSLSLWAAASFTLSVDSRLANKDLTFAIEQKRTEVEALNVDVKIWQQNVAEAVNFKTKHQNTLKEIQARQATASQELHELESSIVAPTMAIYHRAAPYMGVDEETLSLVVRLMWAAAMTLSPIVLVLLISAEIVTYQPSPSKKQAPSPVSETSPKIAEKKGFSALKPKLFPVKQGKNAKAVFEKSEQKKNENSAEDSESSSYFVENTGKFGKFLNPLPKSKKPENAQIDDGLGNNQHTNVIDLSALKYVMQWLESREVGRVTRDDIKVASQLRTRKGVSRLIDILIDKGLLIRMSNNQLAKPASRDM